MTSNPSDQTDQMLPVTQARALLAELIAEQSSRAFYTIGETLHAKLATIDLTLARATRSPDSAVLVEALERIQRNYDTKEGGLLFVSEVARQALATFRETGR